MKHIKLFEQFDDYELEDIFGKEPPLKIVSLSSDDYYIAFNFDDEGKFSLYNSSTGNRYGATIENWNIDPVINDDTVINVFLNGHWQNWRYENLPQEIKNRL